MKKVLLFSVMIAMLISTACNRGSLNDNIRKNSSSINEYTSHGDGKTHMQSTSKTVRIHVVQKGQTLKRISDIYGISSDDISKANELTSPNQLVIGQAIVIPSIQGTKTQSSATWHHDGHSLSSGSSPSFKHTIDVNAYIEPRGEVTPKAKQTVQEISPFLTYLAPFNFQIKRDGTLAAPPLDNLPSIAKNHKAISMMVVTNLENNQFSPELGSLFLNNEQLANKLIDTIIKTARNLGFKDIHFDIEHIKPEDREAYNHFLRKASKRIKDEGYLFSTALAPKTSATQKGAWYTSHDYKLHGEVADFVVIMTYEWGYSGGPPMPVSPITQVRRVLEYALTEIPASKIMMGQNLYGYDWTLPYHPGGKYARALSPQDAIDLARRENVPIQYDEKEQAPFFSYWDNAGREHMVWFEDARSIQAKFNLVKELGIKGVSYWKLGLSFPQNWLLLRENFNIAKRD